MEGLQISGFEMSIEIGNKGHRVLQKTGTDHQCLSCGSKDDLGRKWYCSRACRQELSRGLDILTNLLRALAARYAAFFFDDEALTLDILTNNAKSGHRFVYRRKGGRRPAQDLRDMIDQLGDLWWEKKRRTGKRYRASQHVLEIATTKNIPPELVKPVEIASPHCVGKPLRYLRLSSQDLNAQNASQTIKSAYRRQALKHHPDRGGTSESFRELHKAFQELVSWLETPKMRTRRGLPGKWCFDGRTWHSPLRSRKISIDD